jgi:hypothetical protein
LQVENGLVQLMNRDVVEHVPRLGVVLADAAILVAGDDVLAEVAPPGHGGLALVAHNGQGPLVALLGLGVRVDVHDDNVAQVAHALLRDAQQLGAVLVELDALDGRGELPHLETLARLDVPEADRVVGGPGGDHGRGRVHVDGPDGADVAVVGAEALAVVGEPDADLLVLCDGEDEVAIEVVSTPREKAIAPLVLATCFFLITMIESPVAIIRRGGQAGSGVHDAVRTYLIWVSARSCPARRIGLML